MNPACPPSPRAARPRVVALLAALGAATDTVEALGGRALTPLPFVHGVAATVPAAANWERGG